jgi:hypothetical protein
LAPLSLVDLEKTSVRTRWSHPGGAWLTAAKPFPLYINSLVARGDRNVVVAGSSGERRAFFVGVPAAGAGEQPSLAAFSVERGGAIKPAWTCRLPAGSRGLEVEASRAGTDRETAALISFETPQASGTLAAVGANLELAGGERSLPEESSWGPLIAARLAKEEAPSVIAMAGCRTVAALACREGKPRELWRRPGAGPLAAADFDGDGKKEVAALSWEPSGEGNATVFRAGGGILWATPLHGFPGPLEPWNFGTLTCLACGRFTGAEHEDLLVFARRSTMHSDEGFLLDGKSGKIVWHLDHVLDRGEEMGFGGTPVAVLDHDGDGAEDIHSLYPVNYTIVRGNDGKQLLGRSAADDGVFQGIWAAYATPVLFCFNAKESPDLLWSGGYCLGMTDLEGKARWALTPAQNGYPVDFDGSGKHVIGALNGDKLSAYEPDRGKLLWQLPLGAKCEGAVAADIDGDGAEEMVVFQGARLRSLGARGGAPVLKWELELPAAIRDVILADIDGDSKLEVVALAADGFLYGIE